MPVEVRKTSTSQKKTLLGQVSGITSILEVELSMNLFASTFYGPFVFFRLAIFIMLMEPLHSGDKKVHNITK